jgi:hypothetical protein
MSWPIWRPGKLGQATSLKMRDDMDVKVVEIRFMRGDKATRGFADVLIGDITIKDFRIYQTNGKPTVRNPFSTYKDATGDLKFREVISLPPNVKGEIDALIITEFFRRLKENQNANANR